MKNIHTILSEAGVTIPEDKKADFDKAVAENYKTAAEFEKKVNRLTEDLNAATKRADTAEETLKGFEGKDFEAITRDRDEWQRKHNELVETHKRETEEPPFWIWTSCGAVRTRRRTSRPPWMLCAPTVATCSTTTAALPPSPTPTATAETRAAAMFCPLRTSAPSRTPLNVRQKSISL